LSQGLDGFLARVVICPTTQATTSVVIPGAQLRT